LASLYVYAVGLKARGLTCIEQRKEREREREKLLAEIVSAMEVLGYDTEAVKG
jgi:hypothetical protein